MKRTFQPNNRRRKRTHGFLVRMRTKDGQAVLSRRRRKGRKRLAVWNDADFDSIDTGRKLFSRYSVVFVAANELSYSRIGITATKKLGKANVRNRLKRWTREIYRRQREPLGLDAKSLDFVINIKQNAAEASFVEFSDDLRRALDRVAGASR